jgi:hypothetical protein
VDGLSDEGNCELACVVEGMDVGFVGFLLTWYPVD